MFFFQHKPTLKCFVDEKYNNLNGEVLCFKETGPAEFILKSMNG